MKSLLVASLLLLPVSTLSAKDGEIPTPVDTVKKLYTDHLAQKGPLAEGVEKRNWSFIFGKQLVTALKKGDWGFDPLIFAQDHELENLTFKEIDRDDSGNVFVLVSFKNFTKSIRLVVAMTATDHGYRIENIVEPATGIDLIHDLSNG